MRVQTTKNALEEQDIMDVLLWHERSFLPRVLRLKDYYAGNHDILGKAQRSIESLRTTASTSPT